MSTANISRNNRLIDYFVIIGFDEQLSHHGISVGKLVQRFPEQDWPDSPFLHGLEVFCQPQGWTLKTFYPAPSFFISTLTDISANRHYAAVLSVHESRIINRESDNFDNDDDDDGDLEPLESPKKAHSSPVLYRPKCLVLVSTHPYFDLFRDCLNEMFVAYVNSPSKMESMIGILLGSVRLPPSSGPAISFTLSDGIRHVIRPSCNESVPLTVVGVADLFRQLGTIHNLLCVICALLTDNKLLVHSRSYNRISFACHSLVSLIYPLTYPYTFVPLLPGTVLEVLQSPTPFIMGVHSSFKPKLLTSDSDIIVVDLDCGSVFVPDSVTVPSLPEPYCGRLIKSLQSVLDSGLNCADDTFVIGEPPEVPANVLDKRIRACFVRLFADLFVDYRTCLQVVRVHSHRPLITFHKAAFCGLRGFQDDPFMTILLQGQIFQTFITDRGPPYRFCDLFDQVVVSVEPQLRADDENPSRLLSNLIDLADQLTENKTENLSNSSVSTPLNRRMDFDSMLNIPPIFPHLNAESIENAIRQNTKANVDESQHFIGILPKEVPMGECSDKKVSRIEIDGPNMRRLDVLRNCVKCIFDGKVSDARKLLSAVQLSMKSAHVRVAFCEKLHENSRLKHRGSLLDSQQFDLVVRLMNCVLSNESPSDEHGIAYALLSLSNVYCRRLTPGVHQFTYTCIQDHLVWSNPQFWEAAFFHDVNLQIRKLYLPPELQNKFGNTCSFDRDFTMDTWNLLDQPTALQLASRQMRLMGMDKQTPSSLLSSADRDCRQDEESIVSSQAKHYINLMVCLRTPLDPGRLRRINVDNLEKRGRTYSNPGNDNDDANDDDDDDDDDVSSVSSDLESGFVDVASNCPVDLGEGTVKWIGKFVDKVCSDAGLSVEQIARLHKYIPGLVALHVDNLEQVNNESKLMPAVPKVKSNTLQYSILFLFTYLLEPKLPVPYLLPGERVLHGNLRVFLLPDGRTENVRLTERTLGGCLLPAEGGIFLTNYRVIFKGQPCDPYICEQVVIRTLPVMSITKDKLIPQQLLPSNQPQFTDTFAKNNGHQHLHDALQIRSSTFQLLKIAFDEEVSSGKVEQFVADLEALRWPENVTDLFPLTNADIGSSFADKLQPTKNKYGTIRDITKTLKKSTVLGRKKAPDSNRRSNWSISGSHSRSLSLNPARFSIPEEPNSNSLKKRSSSTKIFDSNLILVQDFIRLRLLTTQDLAHLNEGKATLSPLHRVFSRTFRLSQTNRMYGLCRSYPTFLLVPSRINDDSVRKIAKGFKHNRFPVISWCSDGGAFLLRGAGFNAKNVMSRLKKQAGMLGAAMAMSGRFGTPSTSYSNTVMTKRNSTSSVTTILANSIRNSNVHTQSLKRASLYILGEKSHSKVLKLGRNCEFVPIQFPTAHDAKAAFKKLLRMMAPSSVSSDEHAYSHLRLIDESGWLQLVCCLMRTAGAIVDLIDVQNSSVSLCLEDGWDAVSQLSSLAQCFLSLTCQVFQLFLDPFYRTMNGFRILIEKEWLSFGHRFSHRANHTIGSQSSGIAPIFLVFLDAVHQVMLQYPTAFEFNNFLVKFLAYHSTAAYFQTFLFDSESERVEFQLNQEGNRLNQAPISINVEDEGDFLNYRTPPESLWDYVNCRNERSSFFFNPRYLPGVQYVIRPQSGLACLRLWSFYSEDFLAHGSPYDIESAELEIQERALDDSNTQDVTGIGRSSRRLVDLGYHAQHLTQFDSFRILLEDYDRLRRDLGWDSESWSTTLHKAIRDVDGETVEKGAFYVNALSLYRILPLVLNTVSYF